jgi:hypothetical protein
MNFRSLKTRQLIILSVEARYYVSDCTGHHWLETLYGIVIFTVISGCCYK